MLDAIGEGIEDVAKLADRPAAQSAGKTTDFAKTMHEAPAHEDAEPAPKRQKTSGGLGGLWDDAVSGVKSVAGAVNDGVHALGSGADKLAQDGISAGTKAVRDVAGNGAANVFHGAAEGALNTTKQAAEFTYGVGEGAVGAAGDMVTGTVDMAKNGVKFATNSAYRGQVVQGAEHLASAVAHNPVGTAKAIGSGVADAGESWLRGAGQAAQEGNLGEYLGRGAGSAVVNVGSMLIPGADAAEGANLAAHAGEGLSVASDLAKGGEAVDDAAKVAKGGEAVGDASKLDTAATAAGAVRQETATAGRNEASWTLDGSGRPTHVEATLRESTAGAKRSSAETSAQAKVTTRAGAAGDDDAGHIIGHRFMLDQGERNMFPQNFNFNRGAYKTLENEWGSWTKSGAEVRVHVDLHGGTADRPDEVSVAYDVVNPKTGKVVYKNQVDFDNQAGQSFDRVPARDMKKALQ